jgi:hypothetical protein
MFTIIVFVVFFALAVPPKPSRASRREQPLQMLLINRDDVVEQIAPATLDPALGDAVLPRTLVRRLDRVDLHRSDGNWDL